METITYDLCVSQLGDHYNNQDQDIRTFKMKNTCKKLTIESLKKITGPRNKFYFQQDHYACKGLKWDETVIENKIQFSTYLYHGLLIRIIYYK